MPKAKDTARPLLTSREVMERLNCSYDQVRILVAEGRLAPVRLGTGPKGRMRFEPTEVDRFIKEAKG